jgi:rhamnose utilization protein RhaD (predicted bifunctional aldolase and dehydrogenase)
VLWGGGNTSLKVDELDFRGRPTHVLRVKGSGSDLKSVTRRDFPGVRMDDVLALFEREDMSDEDMVEYLSHTLMEPNSPRPSIETLLHAFVPARSVVHSHADVILALTNNDHAGEVLQGVYRDELAIIPYKRPGFLLSKQVGEAVRSRPHMKGVVLLNHGLITWHDEPREAYRLHIEMVDRATRYAAGRILGKIKASNSPQPKMFTAEEHRAIAAQFAPALRGLLAHNTKLILKYDESDDVFEFLSGHAPGEGRLRAIIEAGAATPDHILSTKRTPLLIEPLDLDVAAAALFLASDRSAKTTGSMLPVDGGLREAFPR